MFAPVTLQPHPLFSLVRLPVEAIPTHAIFTSLLPVIDQRLRIINVCSETKKPICFTSKCVTREEEVIAKIALLHLLPPPLRSI